MEGMNAMSKEQVIVGINGYSRRIHDSSACITVDGELVAMAEEERFTRRKHVYGQVPHHSIAYCLNEARLTVNDVDCLAIGWDFNQVFANIGKTPPSKEELLDLFLPREKFDYSKKPELEMIPHHLAHASSAHYLSGFDNSLVFVIDGQGENQSTSIFNASDRRISLVREFDVKNSLGYFYEALSEYVGLNRRDAGKTMGLASYGDPKYSFDLFNFEQDGYSVNMEQPRQAEMDLAVEIPDKWGQFLEETFGRKNHEVTVYDASKARFDNRTAFSQHYKDIAASGQRTVEEVVKHLLSVYNNSSEPINLCIAGGVGLNCTMNGHISRERSVANLFVPPFANDAGVSVGAALFISDSKPISSLGSASLGPEFSNPIIFDTLRSLGIKQEEFDDIGSKVARLLVEDNIVFWFHGRMEAGPRALGNRSILANPTYRSTHERLNKLKNREQWRPLAPSFLVEKIGDYVFDGSESPFMLKAFTVKPEVAEKIPAAVHVDGTSRAQTVIRANNPEYYHAIEEFEKMTGVPAVMNTSLNLAGDPIVCTPIDAIRTFFSSEADYLVLNNILISKDNK